MYLDIYIMYQRSLKFHARAVKLVAILNLIMFLIWKQPYTFWNCSFALLIFHLGWAYYVMVQKCAVTNRGH